MKRKAKNILACLCLLLGAACTKTPVAPGSISLTIINTLTTPLIVNFNKQDSIFYTNRGSGIIINRNSALEWGLHAGNQIVNLREINNSTTIPTWKDHSTIKLLFNLPTGTVSSLFVAGTIEAPDTLFVKDAPINFQTADSSMGIRFVNLSAAKTIIHVNLIGQPGGSETGNLSYKDITDFKRYPANASIQRYVFEFRDASNGKLLVTNTINNINTPGTSAPNLWRHRNFTLVFRGTPGSVTSPPTAFIVKNH